MRFLGVCTRWESHREVFRKISLSIRIRFPTEHPDVFVDATDAMAADDAMVAADAMVVAYAMAATDTAAATKLLDWCNYHNVFRGYN